MTVSSVKTEQSSPPAVRQKSRAGRRTARSNPVGFLGGFVWLIIVIVPIYWLVVTSLRHQAGFFSANPLALPLHPTMENYRRVLDSGFVTYFVNSAIVTVGAVALTLVVSVMAAYVIVRSRRQSVKVVFQLFLFGLAIPLQATIIPVYYIIRKLGLYDTLLAIVLPSVAFAIPLTVIILVNFLRDVPRELFEAMRVDGVGEWGMLVRLAVPLSVPAITAVGVYDALQVWNGFLFPLILTQSPETRVLPLGLWSFQGEFTVDVPAIMAAVVVSTLPILALYIVGRRYLVSGLTAGFSK